MFVWKHCTPHAKLIGMTWGQVQLRNCEGNGRLKYPSEIPFSAVFLSASQALTAQRHVFISRSALAPG